MPAHGASPDGQTRFLQTTLTTLAAAQLAARTAHCAPTTWTANLGHGFGLALHDYSDVTLDVARDAGFTLIAAWTAGTAHAVVVDHVQLALSSRPVFTAV